MGFHPAEEEPFKKGKHRVQVFCKGEVIGEAHFEVI
jgi:hypothetical protein